MVHKSRSTAAGLVGLAGSLLLLAACGRDPGDGYLGRVRPPAEPVLRVAVAEDPEGLDPTRYSSQPAWRVARMLFEGLLAFTSEGRVVPGVASRWEVTPDAGRYLFFLRSGARWSDGEPVTAHDFVFAWRRVVDPILGASSATKLYPVMNAERIVRGELAPESLGVRAVSDSLLEVILEHPDPEFLLHTAQPPFFPLPRHLAAAAYEEWPAGEAVVGNGPFILQRWRLNDRLIADRNPTYWNSAGILIDGVILFTIADDATALNLYRNGEIDWTLTGTIPDDAAGRFIAEGRSEARTGSRYATYYLELNTRRPPLDDLRIRRALELTMPRAEIVAAVFSGQGPAARTLVVPDIPDWIAPERPEPDADLARRLLAEAGYPGGEGLEPLIYLYNTGSMHGEVAEYLQGHWQTELGITIEPVPLDYAAMEERGQRGEFHLLRSIWLADLPLPDDFLSVFVAGNPNNLTGWTDPGYDALLARARATLDRTERFALLREAEGRLLAGVPVIPLLQFSFGTVQLVKPYLGGLDVNPLDVIGWAGISIDTGWRP
jgi:ABC-type oligopeptide transport system substrate-binding subunit